MRRQAEELAEEASKKFGEVLKGEKAEPSPRSREAAEPAPEGSLGLLFYWLDYSEQQYRGIMRRLATEAGGRGWDPATVGWLRRSNQEFRSIIDKLARAGSRGRPWDPVADAARRQKQAQAEQPPPAPPLAAATPDREMAAGSGVSQEQPPGGEAQKPDPGPAGPVSLAPAAQPAAEAEARQAVDRPQGQETEAKAAAPAPANPDSTEAPAPASKPEIARGEAAAAARRRPADGEEEEAPARLRQAPPAALDTGEAPEEVAAARKREDQPPPTPAAEATAPPAAAAGGGQEAKAAEARSHSDKQAAAVPSPTLLPQRLQSGVARPTASGAAGGSGSERCQLAGVETELPGWYVVKKGDTLWAIAKRHYGTGARYRGIYEANRGQLKKGPDWILPCQRLYLPPQRRGAERP